MEIENEQMDAPVVPLWRNRDYILLWLGETISSIGTGISTIAFPLLVLTLTKSPLDAGLVGTLRVLPVLLFSLLGGVLVDRWNRRWVMLICHIGRALNIASIPLALALQNLTIIHLCTVALIDGTLAVFFGLASTAALPTIATKEQLPAAIAQDEIAESVTALTGPPLGGYFFSLLASSPFLLDLLSYVVATCSLLFVRTNFRLPKVQTRNSLLVDMMEGVSWLWNQPLLRIMTLVVALQLFAVVGGDLGVIILAQQQHASSMEIGFIFSVGGIGGIFGAFLAPQFKRRLPFRALFLSTEWLLALFWFGYAFTPNIVFIALLEAAVAIVDQVMDVVWISYRIGLIPQALQGRVNSVYRLVSQLFRPLGLFVTGLLLQYVGASRTFQLTGLVLVVVAIGASVAFAFLYKSDNMSRT